MLETMNIVFDFGNVLVEWDPVRLIREHYPSAELQRVDVNAFAHTLIEHEDWQAFDRGMLDGAELAARSAQRLAIDGSALHEFIERIPHVLPEFTASVAAVRALAQNRSNHGHRVLYLSNMPIAFADVLEARFPWIACFEGGIFSGREQLAKPDPAIYAALETRYGLRPDETLFLDDVPVNVVAAEARGWLAELIEHPVRVIEALARHGVHMACSTETAFGRH